MHVTSPISEHKCSQQWLNQFRREDVPAAKAFLNHLRLVSFAEFEEALTSEIQKICEQTMGRVVVIPVDKDFYGTSRYPSSAGRIGYTLTNLERVMPDRVRVRLSETSMRAERVEHIILVDDIFATGGRAVRFWNQWATRTLKSWLSYHACELWLVAFAAHDSGVERICERITYLKRHRIRINLTFPPVAKYPHSSIYDLCDNYGRMTGKPRAARGVGGTLTPVIFQHGCPNNSPAILWATGRGWHGLFPNRGIPPDLFSCFGDVDEGSRNAELLWTAGQYKLALKILNAVQNRKKSRKYQLLLAILGLLARRVKIENLPQLMTIPAQDIEAIVSRAREWNLIEDSGKVTSYGIDILNRVRRSHRPDDVVIRTSEYAEKYYFPVQYFGVQRKSSNEPA